MILRILIAAALVAAGVGVASAQTVFDARDPAITERPSIGLKFRIPVYPQQSKAFGEQGEVTVNVCVDVSGRVVAADMVQGSGYSRLDQATVDWIRSGPKFEPARSGNTPVAVCNYIFTYVWRIPGKREIDPTKMYLDWDDLSREDRPAIIEQVNGPIYPPAALAAGIAGPVRLSMCISPYGRMVSAKVIEGDEKSGLAAATKYWIGRFIFSPGKKDGAPVGVCGFPIQYDWKLPE